VDQPERGGLLLRQAEIGHRDQEIAMHGALRAAQQIAEQAVELREHQFGRFEGFRLLTTFQDGVTRHRVFW
jgi:hypothetical protein